MKKLNYLVAIMMVAMMSVTTIAQELPQPSPVAKVEQRIGLTDISIEYSRPSRKGRVIWGELVPYNEVWRVGANKNTLITFSTDVKIEGKDLPAGTYSFFAIPTATTWTIIFNSTTDGWGTGNYDRVNNVLEITTTPIKCPKQESMRFSFEKLQETTGNLVLTWAELVVIIKVDVDVEKQAWINIDKAIAEITEENKADVYRNSAKYTVSTKKRLEEGLQWINASIEAKESWYSYWVKADVQHATGDNKGAIASAKKAIELGEAGAKESGKPFGYKARIEKAITEYK